MMDQLLDIAEQAGLRVLRIYEQLLHKVATKQDGSFLTEADTASHQFIVDALQTCYPDIPVISEESTEQHPFEIRKNWPCFFLVDPLDGTKEFINRNDEFTINIALIKQNKPVMGVIHAPALGVTYYAQKGLGAFKKANQEITPLLPSFGMPEQTRVLVSRSHLCAQTQAFLQSLQASGKKIHITPSGSALKFGLIAEGSADIYPRFAPTMEWDTAAGQVIVNEVAKKVLLLDSTEQLSYNKQQLLNPGFIVQ